MTFQVQRIGNSYGVLFTEEQMRLAGLQEGGQVDVQPAISLEQSKPSANLVSFDEGMRVFQRTEPKWAAAYEELAK